MASFHGTVRLESDPDTSVRALVDVGPTDLTLLSGDEELGAWQREDISVHDLGTSFMLVAGKEKLILHLEERSAFGAAVGLDPAPATLRARKTAPASAKTEPATTGLRGLFRRARAETAPVEPEQITPTQASTPAVAPPPAATPAPAAPVAATPAPIAEPAATDEPATPVGVASPPETERPAAPLEPPPPPSAPRVEAASAAPSTTGDEVKEAAPPQPVVEERAAPSAGAGLPAEESAAASAAGISAEFDSLRQASAANYTEDEVLRRPIGLALGAAGLVLLIGSVLTWGAARLTSGSFDVGRALAGIGAIFAITGAYLAMFNEQRRLGAWGAIGGGVVALVILERSAREARIGYGFMLAVVGTVAVLTLAAISLLGWAAAPPQRRPEED